MFDRKLREENALLREKVDELTDRIANLALEVSKLQKKRDIKAEKLSDILEKQKSLEERMARIEEFADASEAALEAERRWNEGLSNLINYSSPSTNGKGEE